MIIVLLSALVIAAGMLLLTKVHKYQLTGLYKFMGFFIVLLGFAGIASGIMHMVCKERCERGKCTKTEQCLMSGEDCKETMKKECCMEKGEMKNCKTDSVKTDGNEIGDHQEKGQVK